MSRTCTVCEQPFVTDLNAALQAGSSTRELARIFGVPRATLDRHRAHVQVGHRVPLSGPPAGQPPGKHLATAEAMIAAVQVVRGDDFSAQDAAEAAHLRALAEAVDASPSNISALRELRITLDGFRKGVFKTDPSEDMAMAELIASIQMRPDDGTFARTFEAALDAGASPVAAQAAATAATTSTAHGR
jgi:transposase-like protein